MFFIPSSIRGLATPWTYIRSPSFILAESSMGSPVHVLMLSIKAVRGLPRLRVPTLFAMTYRIMCSALHSQCRIDSWLIDRHNHRIPNGCNLLFTTISFLNLALPAVGVICFAVSRYQQNIGATIKWKLAQNSAYYRPYSMYNVSVFKS